MVSSEDSVADMIKALEGILQCNSEAVLIIAAKWPPSRYRVWNDAELLRVLEVIRVNPDSSVKVAVLQLYSALEASRKWRKPSKNGVQCMDSTQPPSVRIEAFKLARLLAMSGQRCSKMMRLCCEPIVQAIICGLRGCSLSDRQIAKDQILSQPPQHSLSLKELRAITDEGPAFIWDIIGGLVTHCGEDFNPEMNGSDVSSASLLVVHGSVPIHRYYVAGHVARHVQKIGMAEHSCAFWSVGGLAELIHNSGPMRNHPDLFCGQMEYTEAQFINKLQEICSDTSIPGLRWYAAYLLSYFGVYGFPSRLGKRIGNAFGEKENADMQLILKNGESLSIHVLFLWSNVHHCCRLWSCLLIREVLMVLQRRPFEVIEKFAKHCKLQPLLQMLHRNRPKWGMAFPGLDLALALNSDGHTFSTSLSLASQWKFNINNFLGISCSGDLHSVTRVGRLLCSDSSNSSGRRCSGSSKIRDGIEDFLVSWDVALEAEATEVMQWTCKFCPVLVPHMHVHKVILWSSCDYFRAMFRSGMQESRSPFIKVPVSWEALVKLVDWLYSDKLPTLVTGCLWDNMDERKKLQSCNRTWSFVGLQTIGPSYSRLRLTGEIEKLDKDLADMVRVASVRHSRIQPNANLSSLVRCRATTVTGHRQGNPPPSDCGCVVVVNVLGKVQVVRQSAKRGHHGMLGKIADNRVLRKTSQQIKVILLDVIALEVHVSLCGWLPENQHCFLKLQWEVDTYYGIFWKPLCKSVGDRRILNPLGLREGKRKLVSASDEQAVAFDPVEATPIRNQASSSTRLTIYFGSNSEPQGRTLGIVSNRVSLSPLQLRIAKEMMNPMNVLRGVRCKDEKLKDGSHGNILQKLSGEGDSMQQGAFSIMLVNAQMPRQGRNDHEEMSEEVAKYKFSVLRCLNITEGDLVKEFVADAPHGNPNVLSVDYAGVPPGTLRSVGVLVMKSLEHAMKRGAPIVVVYLGGAVDCNAHLMVDPRSDGLGVSLCIESILEGADVTHPIPTEEVVLNVNSSSHG
ncbi:BTB/POZ domain-containing protein [Vitis vinifera]|uniref:BTB/POZ domain-containing protein n=1 Tax=Vitis vinifera TaxID=29760 RepID=A0A438J1V8_VITVI|nr:BTB/POZ domain-containing protein [Vitis vinifera]